MGGFYNSALLKDVVVAVCIHSRYSLEVYTAITRNTDRVSLELYPYDSSPNLIGHCP